jgi:hypothetical protein
MVSPKNSRAPGGRGSGLRQTAVDLTLQAGRQAESPAAFGEGDPGQAQVELAGAELLHRGRPGIDLIEELAGPIVDEGRVICHDKNILRQGAPTEGRRRGGSDPITQGWRRWTFHPPPSGA